MYVLEFYYNFYMTKLRFSQNLSLLYLFCYTCTMYGKGGLFLAVESKKNIFTILINNKLRSISYELISENFINKVSVHLVSRWICFDNLFGQPDKYLLIFVLIYNYLKTY